jgi:hypothetical protein
MTMQAGYTFFADRVRLSLEHRHMRTTLRLIPTACIVLSGILPSQDVNAQSTCGSDALWQHQRQHVPDAILREEQLNHRLRERILSRATAFRGGGEELLLIPVVVHIVHNGGAENISDAQVQTGIAHLNQAFSNSGPFATANGVDVGIQFCLAQQDTSGMPTTGITRTISTLTNMISESDDAALKNLIRWDPSEYLNIWLVNSITSSSTGPGVAGYAYFPSAHGGPQDGIVNEAGIFGSSVDNSKVHVHEAGHYLGLYHTFEGGCTNDDCLTDGDRVCDTPPDGSTQAVICGNTTNSCNTDGDDTSVNNPFRAIALGGVGPQNDLYQDYMDYGLQQCQDRYTVGQKERMRAALETARASLLSSPACNTGCGISIQNLGLADGSDLVFGNSITLTPTITGAGTVAYEWMVDGDAVSTSPTLNTNLLPFGEHTLTLVLTNTAAACNVEQSISVNVTCSVPLNIQRSPLHPEPGQLTTFYTTLQPGITAQWFLDGEPMGTGSQFTYTFTTSGYHGVYAISSNGSCSDTSATRGFLVGSCPSAYDRNWMTHGPQRVSFLTDPPTVQNQASTPQFFANEGSATLSNSQGEVIIYSNGLKVWDRNYQLMQNGDSLLGGGSSSQSALIVPNPSNNGIHYLFTTGHMAGLSTDNGDANLRYNVIDMSLNTGAGAVTEKNVFLMGPTTEKLAAVKHCNGHDVWVVAHEFDSDAFYTYLITDAGLNTTPIVQNVGNVHAAWLEGGEGYYGNTAIGNMKFSQQGDKLALAYTKGAGFAQVFNFDAETGAITHPITIRTPWDTAYYAVEFSPNGENLYLSTEGTSQQTGNIYQYRLTAFDSASVAQSRHSVAFFLPGSGTASLILAPDDKIYVGLNGDFHIMSNPDGVGNACGFNYNNVLDVISTSLGVTNTITRNRPAERTSASGPLYVCNYTEGVEYTIDRCAHPANTRWIYNGPNTVVSDTYDRFVIDFEVAGMDTLIAVKDNGCEGIFTDTLFIQVDLQLPLLAPDTTICAPIAAVLTADEGYASYLWNNGSNNSSLAIEGPGTYTLTVTALGGCSLTDQIVLTDFPNTNSLSLGPDRTVCWQTTEPIEAPTGYASYLWSTGSTTYSTLLTSPYLAETLTLVVTDEIGCAAHDTVLVTPQYDGPMLELGPDVELCPGEVLVLEAEIIFGNVATWHWQDNSDLPTYTVWQPGTYWVSATSPCGFTSSVDSIHVSVCDITTGVALNDPYLGISLAPNPTTGDVHIALPNGTMLLSTEVVDVQGKVVLRSTGDGRTLELQGLSSGIYTLRLSTSNGEWIGRVVKE